jgi:hypothetical protein
MPPPSQSPSSGGNPSPSAQGDPSASYTTTPSTTAGSSGGQQSSPAQPHSQQQKRTRVLFSCAPCRASKLKCDRAVPACNQCIKKARVDACAYAPRVEKPKPARSMATRLRRLEATVREMVDTGPPPGTAGAPGGVDGVLDPPAATARPIVGVPAPQPPTQSQPNARVWSQGQGQEGEGESSLKGRGQVVIGKGATTYVGATHIMAMLDDVRPALRCLMKR